VPQTEKTRSSAEATGTRKGAVIELSKSLKRCRRVHGPRNRSFESMIEPILRKKN